MNQLAEGAKKTLEGYVKEMDRRLGDWWDGEIEKEFGFSLRQRAVVKEMLIHGREHNLRAAKRLRGSLVNYGFQLSGRKIDDRVWRAAMAMELVHTALLMHDDFMDEDEVRRGGPTTHVFYGQKRGDVHYGESMAVNSGDAVLCLGFEELLSCGFESDRARMAMKQMLRGITNTAYGQAYDVTLEVEKEWKEEDVLVLHRAKTAIYTFENPLLIGAILGGVSEDVKQILNEYSVDAGVAFQLQDDILGAFGSSAETGKSVSSDLKQGKCTMLVLKVLEKGSAEQRRVIKKVWGNRRAGDKEVSEAKEVIEETGSLAYSRELARKLAGQAAVTVGRLRELGMESQAVDYIQGIAEYMVERKV